MNKNYKSIINYSALALPLAFVGLPIYINISDFYSKKFELNLALIGFVLIFVRLFDLIQDLIVGYFSDLIIKKGVNRKKIIYYSCFCLAVSFFLLFNPPNFSYQYSIIAWFFTFLSLTYLFFNFSIINFEAIPALITTNQDQRIAYYSAKELFTLIGVFLASIAPFIISEIFNTNLEKSFFYFSIIFTLGLLVAIKFFFSKVDLQMETKVTSSNHIAKKLFKPFTNKQFRFISLIFLINSIAVSIPSATIIFYVESVLRSKDSFGAFLALYFLSAIIFIPLWKVVAQKIGKINCWNISILGSIITFIFAFFLDHETANYFYLICFLSGLFLGPDLIIPQSIIADIVSKEKRYASSYFAISNMIVKAGLMIASSSSLIILGISSQEIGQSNDLDHNTLSILYAVIPSILKLLVFSLLMTSSRLLKN